MISKELFEAVMSKKIDCFITETPCMLENHIHYQIGRKRYAINIYELAYKVKEWAMQKYRIQMNSNNSAQCYVHGVGYIFNECFDADTEYEAIFKAGEWILHNKFGSNK